MEDTVTKNIPSIINSSHTLAQVFLFFLFFESYTIFFNGKSLLGLAFALEPILLMPFYGFLCFLGCSRFLWVFLPIVKSPFTQTLTDFGININEKVSFTLFSLFFLTGFYLFLVLRAPQFLPFQDDKFVFLNNAYVLFHGGILVLTGIVTFLSNVYSNESKTN